MRVINFTKTNSEKFEKIQTCVLYICVFNTLMSVCFDCAHAIEHIVDFAPITDNLRLYIVSA